MCTSRAGRVLSLRLQGAGFEREDAEVLVAMWETGSPFGEIQTAAVAMGYEPGLSLEMALEALTRPGAADD